MLNTFLRSSLLSLVIAISSSTIDSYKALAQDVAETRMSGDDLNTVFGLPWAAENWPFSQVIEVQRNSIDPTVTGRIVLDRHGIDNSVLIKAPFLAPYPGRLVLISSWGSFEQGCVAELIIQLAVESSQQDSSVLVPTEISMNVGGQVVTLQAQSDAARRSDAVPFSYTETVWNDAIDEFVNVDNTGVWYTARHLFRVSAEAAAVLSNAPAENVPIRIVLSNRQPFTYEIGSGTAQRWRDVFSFNPNCSGTTSRGVATAPTNPQPSAPTRGSILQERGSLTSGDPTLPDGSLYDIFEFQGEAGRTVRILLQSTEFDTYLILGDIDGNTLAQNDDIGPNDTNSAITFTPPQDGLYYVIVNSYDSSGQGQYLLTIE